MQLSSSGHSPQCIRLRCALLANLWPAASQAPPGPAPSNLTSAAQPQPPLALPPLRHRPCRPLRPPLPPRRRQQSPTPACDRLLPHRPRRLPHIPLSLPFRTLAADLGLVAPPSRSSRSPVPRPSPYFAPLPALSSLIPVATLLSPCPPLPSWPSPWPTWPLPPVAGRRAPRHWLLLAAMAAAALLSAGPPPPPLPSFPPPPA